MRNRHPTISIVIPAFNAGMFLRATLNSILWQNYPATEVIIMDGGSTDSTRQIVSEFGELISIFRSEADKGQLDAVQKGISLASGEIIHWLNADDIMMPGTLQYVASEFSRDASCDILYSDDFAFDESSSALVVGSTIRNMSYNDHILQYRQMYSECVYWRSSISRLLDPGYYDLRVYTDYAFFSNLRRGRKATWVPKRLGAFRIRSDQASQAYSEAKRGEFRRIRQGIYRAHGWSPASVVLRKATHYPSFWLRQQVAPGAERAMRKLSRLATRDRRRRKQAEAFYAWLSTGDPAVEALLFR